MLQDTYATEELARAGSGPSLFGPARADELVRPPWDWRREAARALLLAVEGLWLLAWALFFIRWSGAQPFGATGALVGGWLGLAALALVSGHALLRWQERVGWERSRFALAALIVVSTLAWWAAVSGGLRPFLSEVGAIARLQPGPGFWTLWLAIIVWSRGLDWSHQIIGLQRARTTLHGGLFTLLLLALLGRAAPAVPALLPTLAALWLGGLLALGLTRLVIEEWSLARPPTQRRGARQSGLIGVAALGTLGVGMGVMEALLLPERRAAISAWVWRLAEAPLYQMALWTLDLFVLVVTLVWHVFYWVYVQVTTRFRFNLQPPAPEGGSSTGSMEAFFDWLLALVPPPVWFALKLVAFLLFVAFVLFLLITRLDRVRYAESQRAPARSDPEAGRSRRPRLPPLRRALARRPAGPEPPDAVRRIYVRLVRLGAERGAAWRARRTPYEHEAALRLALPGHDADIHLITEQYVRVRYASAALTLADQQAVEAAWGRVAMGVEE